MTFSVFCAELPTPVTFDSLGAAINAACKFAIRGCHRVRDQGGGRICDWNAVISKSNV
jgi:hypothetical protein